MIEENRALTEMSSLPFVIGKNGKKVAWFNYTVEPTEIGMVGNIRKLFVLDDEMHLQMIYDPCNVELSVGELEDPSMTEDQYFTEFTTKYKDVDEKGNLELLKESVLTAFMPIYEVAIQKLGGK